MNRRFPTYYYSFLILDILCLIFSLFVSFYLRHHSFELLTLGIYKEIIFVLLVVDILLFFFMNPFENVLKRGYLVELEKTLVFDFFNAVITIAYMFAVKSSEGYSRLTLVLTYFFYFLFSYISRIVLKKYLYNKSLNALKEGAKSLLLVCNSNEIEDAINSIDNSYDDHRINAIYVTDNKNVDIESIETLNSDNVLHYISTNWVDDILILDNYKNISDDILLGFKDSGIPVHVRLEKISIFEDKTQVINTFGDYDVITAARAEHSFWQLFIKRATDIIGGLIGCLITLILIIVIGPIIYIKSPGNIFYVSDRVGKNGKIFKFYKFKNFSILTNSI